MPHLSRFFGVTKAWKALPITRFPVWFRYVHNVKIVQLHKELHCVEEYHVQLRGLQLHFDTTKGPNHKTDEDLASTMLPDLATITKKGAQRGCKSEFQASESKSAKSTSETFEKETRDSFDTIGHGSINSRASGTTATSRSANKENTPSEIIDEYPWAWRQASPCRVFL